MLTGEQKNAIYFSLVLIGFWLLIIINSNWTLNELKRTLTEPTGVFTWMILGTYIYASYLAYKKLKEAFADKKQDGNKKK